MKKSLVFGLLFMFLQSTAQEAILTVGKHFPDLIITQISNAPVKEWYLNKVKDQKWYILNFWGTWCSPCIPEMDSLARLQKRNAGTIQIIAISDDDEVRKAKYLRNKPSDIWLATDTAYTLYNMFNLAYVGQSAIISPDKKIAALVRTDSINQNLIDRLLRGETVAPSAGIKETLIAANEDPFGVDSLTSHNFSLRGYKQGMPSMGKQYSNHETYKNRRLSWFNVSIGLLYREAYGINSTQQEVLDGNVHKQEVDGFNSGNKAALYCADLLVTPDQKDSLYQILQQQLNACLPVKARLEKRIIEVFALKQLPTATPKFSKSVAAESSYGFSGKGYSGTRVTIQQFAADYLTNELRLPVVDKTGLLGYYDITTTVTQRNEAGIIKSLETLGLVVEKVKQEMPVIVYFK